jgi:hypothetical protein
MVMPTSSHIQNGSPAPSDRSIIISSLEYNITKFHQFSISITDILIAMYARRPHIPAMNTQQVEKRSEKLEKAGREQRASIAR